MSTGFGFIPAPLVAPAVPVAVKAVAWSVGVAGAIIKSLPYWLPAVQAPQQKKEEAVSVPVETTTPPAAQPPLPSLDPYFPDSPIAQPPEQPQAVGPVSPLTTTQKTIEQIPKPASKDPQAPVKPGYTPVPLPNPASSAGSGVAGGVQLSFTWGLYEDMRTKLTYRNSASPLFAGITFNRIVYQYRVSVSGSDLVYQPEILLQDNSVTVQAWRPGVFLTYVPDASQYNAYFISALDPGDPGFAANMVALDDPTSYFLPASPYVPAPVAPPEETPAYEPQPAPNPFQPLPSVVPDVRPLPEADPEQQPGRAVPPVVVPTLPRAPVFPAVVPDRDVVPVAPNSPQPLPALTPEGKPATQTPIPITPPGAHVVGDGKPVVSTGPAPTMDGIAQEVGRIEEKVARLLDPNRAPVGSPLNLLELIRDNVFNIVDFFTSITAGGAYDISSPCELDENGERIVRSVEYPGALQSLGLISNKIDAVAALLQQHKDLKQPICKQTPAVGENVTVNFVQVD